MDQDLLQLMHENNSLLRENLEVSRRNSKKIKKIQSYIRRTIIVKTLYWVVVIGFTFGAVYVSKPYVTNVIETYNTFKENLNRSTELINDPGSVFQDVNLVEYLFGSSSS